MNLKRVWIYFVGAILLSACSAKTDEYMLVSHPKEAELEHLLTVKIKQLSLQLLQSPYFSQGSFKHSQPLRILFPHVDIDIPVLGDELQTISAKEFARTGWFDIQVLDPRQTNQISRIGQSGYLLAITLVPSDVGSSDHFKLTFQLINNKFNTVEIQAVDTFALTS